MPCNLYDNRVERGKSDLQAAKYAILGLKQARGFRVKVQNKCQNLMGQVCLLFTKLEMMMF